MASLYHFLLIFFSTLFLTVAAEFESVTTAFRPSAFVLQVHKESATNLHVANIQKRTHALPVPFLVDLNGGFLWVNCERIYLSITYQAPMCHSTQCSRANSHYCHTCSSKVRPGCHNNTCGLIAINPVTRRAVVGELAQDVLSIQSVSQKGSNAGPIVTIPRFLFACTPDSILLRNGLPKNVQGVVGLGHTTIALPAQISSQFGAQSSFALCLTSLGGNGAIFFGNNGPYYMIPGVDISQSLRHTPLTIGSRGEYYIQVSSIQINDEPLPLNTSLLSVNRRGKFGGTMISTTSPYTILEHSIYLSLVQFYAKQFSEVPQVQAIEPFGLCYDGENISRTPVGPGVPTINLVLHNQNTIWRIFGANSMVQARPGVFCLAFVDGGLNPKASIVIGTHQLEDFLVQFDLARSRLGFASVLLKGTSCGNFNFTSTT